MPQLPADSNDINPRFVPRFRLRQWVLVAVLCIGGLWLVVNRSPSKSLEFESVSMASAKADYYLESFTLLSTQPNGDADYTLSAETLIHLPSEELARLKTPSLTVNNENGRWELIASTGELPDHGQSVKLAGGVQLQQLAPQQAPLRLTTPSLLLDRKHMQLHSNEGVQVEGSGWQLSSDKMTGLIESGKLIFRDNNHATYSAPTAQKR